MQGAPYFTPRLRLFEVRGEELQPGDHVQIYSGQVGHTIRSLWCSMIPGTKVWDPTRIHFRERDFPFAQYDVSPLGKYWIWRPDVYEVGWSPEECAAKRAAWEKENERGAEDDGGPGARLEGGRGRVGL